MLEFNYDQSRNTETTTDAGSQEVNNMNQQDASLATNKVNPLGFTSEDEERRWMDQVRRECTKTYRDRIR